MRKSHPQKTLIVLFLSFSFLARLSAQDAAAMPNNLDTAAMIQKLDVILPIVKLHADKGDYPTALAYVAALTQTIQKAKLDSLENKQYDFIPKDQIANTPENQRTKHTKQFRHSLWIFVFALGLVLHLCCCSPALLPEIPLPQPLSLNRIPKHLCTSFQL